MNETLHFSKDFHRKLDSFGLTRRDFLKLCGGIATVLGLSNFVVPQIAQAIEQAAKKPSVIWSQFSTCTGCTESLLKAGSPSVAKIILDIISLDYHNTVMSAAGEKNMQVLEDLVNKGGYVWLVEGAIPSKTGYGQIEDKDIRDWAKKIGSKASAVVAIGTCASYGGIPAAGPNPSGAMGVSKATGKKVINLPGCPANPDWMVATLVYYLTYKKAPELDSFSRPKFIYKQTIHDLCPRRGMFEVGNFVPYPGASEEALGYCLYRVGCKGPATYSNCPEILWNQRTNWCNGAGQCIGCTENNFPDAMSPFYSMLPNIAIPGFGGTAATADKMGAVIGGAAVAGIGIHAVAGLLKGPKGKSELKVEELKR